MEAELKAEHWVEPESDIQFCAIAPGAAARIDSRAVLVLRAVDLDFRLPEALCWWAAIVADGRNPDNDSILSILALSVRKELIAMSWSIGGLSSLIFRFGSPHPRAPRATFALLIFSTLGVVGVNNNPVSISTPIQKEKKIQHFTQTVEAWTDEVKI